MEITDYLNTIKNNTPNCTCKWHDKILKGQIVYHNFQISYSIDCSALDFKDLDKFNDKIQSIKYEFYFDDLCNIDESDKNMLKEALYPHIPYFTELAKKELEIQKEK